VRSTLVRMLAVAAAGAGAAVGGGCKSSTAPGVPRTLTGTITLPDSLKSYPVLIGHFDTTYATYIHGTGATIDSITKAPPPLTPLDIISVTGDTVTRTYSYDLPADPRGFGTLVAWVDKSPADNKLTLPGEHARFPVKRTSIGSRVIIIWGSSGIGSDPSTFDYVASDGSNFFELAQIGPGGFNFTF